jgi:hypothetical protein
VELEAAENDRLQAVANLDKYHQETKTWRDKIVLRKNINPGDMVQIHHPNKQGKLQSQWYGPFIGLETSHTWNADNLRRFYP